MSCSFESNNAYPHLPTLHLSNSDDRKSQVNLKTGQIANTMKLQRNDK